VGLRSERDGEILQAWVVRDQEHGACPLWQFAETRQQLVGARGIQSVLDLDHVVSERGADQLQRLARTLGRRAEDELELDPLAAQMRGQLLACLPSPRCKWPFVVGEPGLVPARLRVAQEVQVSHRRQSDHDAGDAGDFLTSA
jgi:hypothetical protein